MNRTLSVLATLCLSAVASAAMAQATVSAAIDWSRMEVQATGTVFGIVPVLPIYTQLIAGPQNMAGALPALSYNQNGQTASLSNGQLMSANTSSTNEQRDFIASVYGRWDLVLTGPGSVTFRVPYEYHLSQTGDHLAKAIVSTRIDGTADSQGFWSVTSSSDQFNEGPLDRTGFFTYTLTNNGLLKNYRLNSVVYTAIIPGVPEPETYAMMGLGIGAIWIARRRRSKA